MTGLFEQLNGKRCLVTGVAGFIGSHLAERLLASGCRVVGIDLFTDYYDRKIKEGNVSGLLDDERFTLLERDLSLIEDSWFGEGGFDFVFHQAAQAGVRASWGKEFSHYTHHNVLSTQRLLEWARKASLVRLVYASSSSVYGDTGKLPMEEKDLPRPLSPYGVTKLAAEHLCNLYQQNFKLPVVSLRYFTVYGPRQRPDMAFHRFIRAILGGRKLTLYGSGEQTRDFTYIGDIVQANLQAALAPGVEGRVFNLGGGTRITINETLEMLEGICGKKALVSREEVQAGDPPHTYADTSAAREAIGFNPRVGLEDGLRAMVDSLA